MKTIQIPMNSNPFTVVINNKEYSYTAGQTIEVPDEVAGAIEDALELAPKHKTRLSRIASFADRSITELTANDLVGVANIGNYAFSYCVSLTSVSFWSGVTSIGTAAFSHCNSIKSIIIPDTITAIGAYAFFGCTSLTDITIGKGVAGIGSSAFNTDVKANSVTYRLLRTTPPVISPDTIHADSLAKIIVPKGCGGVYKAASNWSTFADYIEEAK